MKKTTKVPTYRDYLTESKEVKEARDVDHKVRMAYLQIESDISTTHKNLGDAEDKLRKLKSSLSPKFQDIIDWQLEVESLQDGLKRLRELKTELFRGDKDANLEK